MVEIGDGREVEEVGDKERGRGGMKLRALRSGSKGELRGRYGMRGCPHTIVRGPGLPALAWTRLDVGSL